MIPRLVTILILCVAIVGVSWGMRARAQSDTLEGRVAALEAQVADLQARSLPAPDPSARAAGMLLPNDTNSFKMQCYISELIPGGNPWQLQCVRLEPSVAAAAQPTGQAPAQSGTTDGYPVYLYFVDGASNPVGGACVELSTTNGTYEALVCDNDSDDLDPTVGAIETSVDSTSTKIHETAPPAGCQPIRDVDLSFSQGIGWQQLVHEC